MKKLFTLLFLLMTIGVFGQVKVETHSKLKINHGDLTFILDEDTNSFVSIHNVKYSDFKKIDGVRDDRWHSETYKRIYSKEPYVHSGYDLGHLTPSNITSYNDSLNYHSFSFFNQAPQVAGFNRGKWKRLEGSVEDSIKKYKCDVQIITGVLYDNSNKDYLSKSRIKIPMSYYKIMYFKIKKKEYLYVWIGSNNNGEVMLIDLKKLNEIATINKNNIKFVK